MAQDTTNRAYIFISFQIFMAHYRTTLVFSKLSQKWKTDSRLLHESRCEFTPHFSHEIIVKNITIVRVKGVNRCYYPSKFVFVRECGATCSANFTHLFRANELATSVICCKALAQSRVFVWSFFLTQPYSICPHPARSVCCRRPRATIADKLHTG